MFSEGETLSSETTKAAQHEKNVEKKKSKCGD